ncbi:GNAT family N-acetyltransferase [Paenibacillus sp. FSL H8-0034]|uniref:GNAT family N-acetyltransferase n=1 Tax=Paenibacillus sp. FSL H8-0034 TaxID=2954671 RepID=UPI0030FB8B50
MDYTITHYERPNKNNKDVVDQVIAVIDSMVGKWFTSDVPHDTRKDLFFHDALCLEIGGKIASFIAFTSSEGSIVISLMGTHSDYHRKGYGSILIESLFEHTKHLGFNRIFAWTVPPKSKASYQQTVDFYTKHGFIIEKEYSELWQSGTIQLAKYM